MSKKNMTSDSGTRKTAATKKTQVSVVDNTSRPLTPAELTYVARFITEFSELSPEVPFTDDGPYFYCKDLEQACSGGEITTTMDKLTLCPDLGYMVFLTEVPEFIREFVPTSHVTICAGRAFGLIRKQSIRSLC